MFFWWNTGLHRRPLYPPYIVEHLGSDCSGGNTDIHYHRIAAYADPIKEIEMEVLSEALEAILIGRTKFHIRKELEVFIASIVNGPCAFLGCKKLSYFNRNERRHFFRPGLFVKKSSHLDLITITALAVSRTMPGPEIVEPTS